MAVFLLISPSGNMELRIVLQEGRLFYETSCEGTPLSGLAPLGMELATQSLTQGFTHIATHKGSIDETYVIPAYKKAICQNTCNALSLEFANSDGRLLVEARAYEDGIAFRLVIPGDGPSAILREYTGFAVPKQAKQVLGMKIVFSYEDHYHPIPLEDMWQNRFAMPMLVEAGQGKWALYTEAAVFGDYGGSNLLSSREMPELLMLQKAEDKLTPIMGNYPVTTPWRVVMGANLAAITESNLLENLNPPSIVDDVSFIRPGLSAWSWMAENDSVTDPVRIRQYVDYASEMHFPYYLADWGWPDTVDIPDLVKYAAPRNVRIWIWEHSADIRDAKTADEKLKLWASWGVAGVKIDFFESDGAERMTQFTLLAELCAKYRLMLNFHGCTKPAGEQRTWPHVMTREGVQGAEYLQNYSNFTPMGPDAAHNCTLPFTRNAVGPMDYTPLMYKTYLTDTTDMHQTALLVVFLSYIQHIGERSDYVLESPLRLLLSILPASWDDSHLLEGFPGSYVTVARRKGEDWFVAGICARRPRSASFDLAFLADGNYTATLYADDLSDLRPFDVSVGALPPADETICQKVDACRQRPSLHQHNLHLVRHEAVEVARDKPMSVAMAANGGFILHIKPKR